MEPSEKIHLNRDEMQHRAELSRAGVPSTVNFERVDAIGDDPPFVNEEQMWVLFSTSHSGFAPVARDAQFPGIRIYGCFDTHEAAIEYAKDVLIPSDPKCSIQLNKTHEWICACKNPANLADADYVKKKTDALLSAHASRLEKSQVDFRENVHKMQQAEEFIEPLKETTETDEDMTDADKTAVDEPRSQAGEQRPKMLPRMCELSGQAFVCASFVQDTQSPDEPEFLFRVYGCFSTLEDADRYVRNVAGERVTEYDINVVTLLKWIFPTRDIDVLTHYRASELTKIMQHHREQPSKVDQYHKTMKQRSEAPADPSLENAPTFSEVVV